MYKAIHRQSSFIVIYQLLHFEASYLGLGESCKNYKIHNQLYLSVFKVIISFCMLYK